MTPTTETDEWQLPIDILMQAHRARIAGNEDMVPAMVETWHIGEPVASCTVWIHNSGDVGPRDAGLYAAKVMASLSGCDYIMFSYDTHMTSLVNNPKTGQPWKHGEMQAMCDEDGFCETGQMRDNLVASIVRRSDRKLYFRSIPYHFHKGEVIFYDEPEPMDETNPDFKGEMHGIIVDGLRETMSTPTVGDSLAHLHVLDALGFAADDPKIRMHQILAGVQILSKVARDANLPQMFICAVPAHTEEEAELIKASAQRGGMEAEMVSPGG